MPVILRKALIEDAAGIAKVHIDSWRSTYSGIVAEDTLSALSYERRARGWKEFLENPQPNGFLYVAENESGEIVGFISFGPGQPGEPEYAGEVYAIYLLKQCQGQGVGRKLMETAIQELCSRGITSMLLWVLKDNLPARRFYETLGGRFLKEKPVKIGTQDLIEVAYGWKDLPSALQ